MSAMRAIILTAWEWWVGGARTLFSTTCAIPCVLVVAGVAYGPLVTAQESDAPAGPNDVPAAEVLSQLSDSVQGGDASQVEDMAPPVELAPTNGLSQANSPGPGENRTDRVNRFDNSRRPDSSNSVQGSRRSQSDDRRSRGRRSLRSRYDQSGSSGYGNEYGRSVYGSQTNGSGGTNLGPVTLDYAAFKVIVDRNIFDPNRYPRGPGASRLRPPPRSVDYVTLVGTMTYEKGTFAFFDGSSSAYRKALKLTDSIAGYKVTNIAPNGVKLAAGTNQLELNVGGQLRREEEGPWLLAGETSRYTPTPAVTATNTAPGTNTAGSDATAGGAESEILKRLMEKREKE